LYSARTIIDSVHANILLSKIIPKYPSNVTCYRHREPPVLSMSASGSHGFKQSGGLPDQHPLLLPHVPPSAASSIRDNRTGDCLLSDRSHR